NARVPEPLDGRRAIGSPGLRENIAVPKKTVGIVLEHGIRAEPRDTKHRRPRERGDEDRAPMARSSRRAEGEKRRDPHDALYAEEEGEGDVLALDAAKGEGRVGRCRDEPASVHDEKLTAS